MVRPPSAISPERGRSRPAIERSVVVLPQPLGPSSVNSLPSGTSKATSRAAGRRPCSLTYSVLSADAQHGRSPSFHAELAARELRDLHQHEQQHDQHHAQRGELDVLAVLPQLPDHDRYHLRAGAVEQDRARQLADRHDRDIDPAGDQPGLEQRQHDAAELRAQHAPLIAADSSSSLWICTIEAVL